jgi:hypothetical protein
MRPALPDAQAARRHAADMLEQQSATKKRCRNQGAQNKAVLWCQQH